MSCKLVKFHLGQWYSMGSMDHHRQNPGGLLKMQFKWKLQCSSSQPRHSESESGKESGRKWDITVCFFNKLSRRFLSTLIFEKHLFKACEVSCGIISVAFYYFSVFYLLWFTQSNNLNLGFSIYTNPDRHTNRYAYKPEINLLLNNT